MKFITLLGMAIVVAALSFIALEIKDFYPIKKEYVDSLKNELYLNKKAIIILRIDSAKTASEKFRNRK